MVRLRLLPLIRISSDAAVRTSGGPEVPHARIDYATVVRGGKL